MYADYTKAVITSIEVLKKYRFNKVPIDIHYIIKQTSNIKLCEYSRYANNVGCSIEEVIEFFQSDLGAISRDPDNNRYVIFYNDTIGNPALDRFTIAHELGHYFLGHFDLITEKVLRRGGFSAKKYKAIENEANAFARNLLAPVPLYNKIPLTLSTTSYIWRVMDTFDISFEAAGARINFAILDNYRITDEDIEYFNTYKMPYYTCCEQCKNPEIEGSNYCSICGAQLIDDFFVQEIILKQEGKDYMIYSGIEVNKYSKAKVCPVCENEEPEYGEYCSICGTHITNRCTNPRCINGPDDGLFGAFLPGNARYCSYCGSKSTFLQNELLKPWQEEKFEREVEEEIPDVDEIFDVPF